MSGLVGARGGVLRLAVTRSGGPAMTDPEASADLMPVDIAEAEADLSDEFDRPAPLEAAEADVADQKRALGGDDEDEYRE